MKGTSNGQRLKIATTTSTRDSGLLDLLNGAFERKTGSRVEALSKGTGAAIQSAIDQEVDLVFVHSRPDEDKFVEDGYGVNRRDVMYNDFILVGPKDDPAGIGALTDAAAAFSAIRNRGEAGAAKFYSRGDRSGTHIREMEMWRHACVRPASLWSRDWYVHTGAGMGETLRQADEGGGYTLTDRGTWLKHREALGRLEIHLQGALNGGDPRLLNLYSVIAVNPLYNPHANYDLAMSYIAFVTGLEGQQLIGDYRLKGQQLFIPDSRQGS
jgi:tungstate transport system substrate-binding protein